MGKRPKKPCAKIGCHNLVEYPNIYCNNHIEYQEKLKAKYYNDYDSTRKNDKEWNFYRTKEWKRFREYILSRDNYLCQECLKDKQLNPGNTVHHIITIREDYSKRLDEDNCVTVCHSCHDKIHRTK